MNNNKSLSILVIDDDDIILKLVATALIKEGYHNLKTTSHGRHALALIDSAPEDIDLLLCDLNMPEIDGIEILRHLGIEKFSGAIILFSGENKQVLEIAETIAKNYKLNLLGSVQKPLEIKKLHDLIYKLTITPNATPTNKPKIRIDIKQLKLALENDEIVPFYQARVSTNTREIMGVESLARWQHPDYGILSPFRFITLAEQNDLIDLVTAAMVRHTIAQLQQWHQQDLKIHASINFSGKLFPRLDLPEHIESLLVDAGLPQDCLIIEITENQLLANFPTALEIVSRMSLKHFRISIDDFGTGHFSTQQLEQLPFNELKIDQQFVVNASKSRSSMAILEASISLAKRLNMMTVAEGVETQAQWDLVSRLGCDMVQGYLISKPLPADEFTTWAKDYQASL